jgi:hypothetical protein
MMETTLTDLMGVNLEGSSEQLAKVLQRLFEEKRPYSDFVQRVCETPREITGRFHLVSYPLKLSERSDDAE